ncbi:MAG: hypothetical protein LWY06_07360 [Firmicutes bacterium]|nr:hypothetical protein [Bacillota bacterium]
MKQVRDEELIISVKARRKGRSQNACEVEICITDGSEIILRTEDVEGVAPIVVVLNPNETELLELGLAEARRKCPKIS